MELLVSVLPANLSSSLWPVCDDANCLGSAMGERVAKGRSSGEDRYLGTVASAGCASAGDIHLVKTFRQTSPPVLRSNLAKFIKRSCGAHNG